VKIKKKKKKNAEQRQRAAVMYYNKFPLPNIPNEVQVVDDTMTPSRLRAGTPTFARALTEHNKALPNDVPQKNPRNQNTITAKTLPSNSNPVSPIVDNNNNNSKINNNNKNNGSQLDTQPALAKRLSSGPPDKLLPPGKSNADKLLEKRSSLPSVLDKTVVSDKKLPEMLPSKTLPSSPNKKLPSTSNLDNSNSSSLNPKNVTSAYTDDEDDEENNNKLRKTKSTDIKKPAKTKALPSNSQTQNTNK